MVGDLLVKVYGRTNCGPAGTFSAPASIGPGNIAKIDASAPLNVCVGLQGIESMICLIS